MERTVTGLQSGKWVEWNIRLERLTAELKNQRGARLVDGIVVELQRLIELGELRPGDRLPPERYFAQLLSVSRATLREAIHELELRGAVARYQGRGTIVTSVDPAVLSRRFLQHLTVPESTILQVTEFRLVLETHSVERAASAATQRDIVKLERTVEQMRRGISRRRFAELDKKFHALVADATHNPILVAAVRWASDWADVADHRSFYRSHEVLASLEGHERILDGIRDHDPVKARKAMSEHLTRAFTLTTGEDFPQHLLNSL